MKEHDATETEYLNGYADGKPKWISVKERLPEIPSDKIADGYVQIQVLVWCDKGRKCAWFQVDTKKFYDQDGWLGIEVYGVTHWMPLPEPPKGE